ncbi:protein FAM210A isoform X2 [Cryptotermes secundus]|uniref:protein FAM210A isoform X2 n=1 Tax=Cryptotermes secundus TaxID=105785 RepID=UPI000CD7BE71|nr:protein FAM210A isoform X2 [Cryptotermes secundus]
MTKKQKSDKSALTAYQQKYKCPHTECVKSFMNFTKFIVLSHHEHQSVFLFRTSSFTRNIATNGNKQTEKSKVEEPNTAEAQKLSLLQRFKQMYRDYWYVLVPVHLITSLGWFAGFYYLAKSGVDVIALLESMSISEKVINPLRDSSAGYIAIAYALYKIATPVRYTVTLGGTTISINYLKKWGYIKPIPPREKLKEMYQEKKATLIRETAEELKLQQEKLKKTSENMIRGYRERAGKPEK